MFLFFVFETQVQASVSHHNAAKAIKSLPVSKTW